MFNQSLNDINIGNARETFFFNQLNEKYVVQASKKADFLVSEKFTFEIGGKSKSKKQIKEINNAFVVRDQTEIGNDNIIPLWLFGFMY